MKFRSSQSQNNSSTFLKPKFSIIFVAILLLTLAISACFASGCKETKQIDEANAKIADEPAASNQFVVMSTSDMHGKCWDYDIVQEKDAPQNFLSASTAASKVKKQFGDRTFLFDNGDLYQGTDISSFCIKSALRGENDEDHPITLCLEEMKYDGMTLGNHEFNYQWDYMNKQYSHLKEHGVNVVCANIYNEATGQRVFPGWMTKKINVDGQDITLAVIGLENTDIPRWDIPDNYPGLIFHSPENTTLDLSYEVKKAQADMKAAGINPDFTMVSMHSGGFKESAKYDDKADYEAKFQKELEEPLRPLKNTENQIARVAALTSGIDLIINGHDHVDWYSGYQATNAENKSVPIVNGATHDLTKTVFNVNKNADGTKSITLANTNNLKLENFKSDENLKKIIKPYADKITEYVNEKIGTLKGNWENGKNIESKEFYTQQSDSIDLINRSQIYHSQKSLRDKYSSVDKFNEYLASKFPDKGYKVTGDDIQVDFSISSNPIKVQAKEGEASIKNLVNLYKYDNTLYVVPVKGQTILDLLNYNADYRYDVSESGDNKQVKTTGDVFTLCLPYGLNFTYDMSKPTGQKVVVGDFSNGKKFDPNATYLMAMNNYQLGNSSNFVLGKISKTDYVYSQLADDGAGYTILDTLIEYTKDKTSENGAVYNTAESDKNGEAAYKWDFKL